MTKPPSLPDLSPDPDQRISVIHAWITTHSNGAEGLMSADMPMPGRPGDTHMPLLSSKLHVAQRLRPLAEEAQSTSLDGPNPVVKIELRTFVPPPRE